MLLKLKNEKYCDLDLENAWMEKDTYFRIATTLFGILFIDEQNVHLYHLHYKHWEN